MVCVKSRKITLVLVLKDRTLQWKDLNPANLEGLCLRDDVPLQGACVSVSWYTEAQLGVSPRVAQMSNLQSTTHLIPS